MIIKNLEKLLENGCLGFYDQVEITEIFACLPDKKTVINILTIVVAENRNGATLVEPTRINKKRIKLRSLRDWSFGIQQYTKSISDVLTDFTELNMIFSI